jgi:cytochrome c biogenesis protein CcmG/thiol:disulfide interchange protein DsbE
VSARSLTAILAVCAVLGLLVYGLASKGSSRIAVGAPVPDRALPYLSGGKGDGRIADYRGHWVLVNLWASWCLPCRREAPVLERFYRRFRRQGVTVLGINVEDNESDARAFLREFHPSYPELRSRGAERSEAFGATGVPENYLVNPRGRLAVPIIGPVDGKILAREVVPLLGAVRVAGGQVESKG